MAEANPNNPIFVTTESQLREVVRTEVQAVVGNSTPDRLLQPAELASRLKVPVSWVYEQSRQGKIPTIRIGHYIRFDYRQVIASQQKPPS